MTEDDRVVFARHCDYLRHQFAEGKIIFAGPSVEENEDHFAVVVLNTETKADAVQIMNADPAVACSLLTSHVTEFGVFLSREFNDECPAETVSTQPAAAPICYVEIPAPDIERAGAFYTSVFGWQIKPSNLSGTPYWEFHTGDGQLSGGLVTGRAVHDGGALLYLKVQDIETTLRQVVDRGGAVVTPKVAIGGGHGFSAIFKDPNGNRLGLYAPD